MTKRMRSFIEKIGQDVELRKKMEACETIDEAFSIAQSFLGELSFEEFSSGMRELIEYSEKKADKELTDEELGEVSKGLFYFDNMFRF